MAKGISTMGTFFAELVPTDFVYTCSWIIPVFDTLAMSVGGNPVLAVLFSLPLALLATANSSHLAVHTVSRSNLYLLRTVPDLIMGLIFMAAVGIGALRECLPLYSILPVYWVNLL